MDQRSTQNSPVSFESIKNKRLGDRQDVCWHHSLKSPGNNLQIQLQVNMANKLDKIIRSNWKDFYKPILIILWKA